MNESPIRGDYTHGVVGKPRRPMNNVTDGCKEKGEVEVRAYQNIIKALGTGSGARAMKSESSCASSRKVTFRFFASSKYAHTANHSHPW